MATKSKQINRRTNSTKLTKRSLFASKYAIILIAGVGIAGLVLSYFILVQAGTEGLVPEVRPEAFGGGAPGNGTYNDCADIQKALDSASAKGQAVRLKANKTYHCTTNLKLGSNTILLGNSNAVLKFTWFYHSGGGSAYILTKTSVDGKPIHDIAIRKLIVEGASNGQPSGANGDQPNGERLTPGIQINNVDRFIIERTEVRNIPGIAIMYLGSANGVLNNNYVHNSGRDGISAFRGKGGLTTHHVRVTNNRIEKTGDDAIAVNGSTVESPLTDSGQIPNDITIYNNQITGWDSDPNGKQLGRGIVIVASNNIIIKSNNISNAHSAGVYIKHADVGSNQSYPPTDIRVVDNNIINAGQSFDTTRNRFNQPIGGIVIDGGRNVILTNNMIVNPAVQSIMVINCQDCRTVNAVKK